MKDIPAESRAFFRWKPAAWLKVSGPDAPGFLQGQFTNDLRSAGPGGVYGLWLNQKGRVLADSFVIADNDAFWIGSYFSSAESIRERLEAYIIADDVTVEDQTSAWTGVTLLGPVESLGLPEGPAEERRFPGRRGLAPAVEWLMPRHAKPGLDEALKSWTELGVHEMERRRILARIPAVPVDIGPGELPNEGGLDASAISYTKGCYLGQEVIARLRSMGQVRRQLFLVRGEGQAPAAPAPLYQGDRQVGEIRSVAADGMGFIGLALLSLLHTQLDAPLHRQPGSCEVACVIVPA